jgi:hypothetical protein
LNRDPAMPEARRLLGVCYAAEGHFSEALACWAEWTHLASRTPGEESEAPAVERLRQGVENLLRELARYRE